LPHAAYLFDWQFHSHLHLHFPFAVNLLEKRAPKVTAGRGAAVNLTLGSCRQKVAAVAAMLPQCCRCHCTWTPATSSAKRKYRTTFFFTFAFWAYIHIYPFFF